MASFVPKKSKRKSSKRKKTKNPRLANFSLFKKVPKGTCRWCHGPVAKPRRFYCCDECLNQIAIRVNWGAAVRAVVLRDKGICAECGLDCRALKRRMRLENQKQLITEFQIPKHLLNKRFWQCDHIKPVKDGGGGNWKLKSRANMLDNLQTLCFKCHGKKTKSEQQKKHKPNVATKRKCSRKSST